MCSFLVAASSRGYPLTRSKWISGDRPLPSQSNQACAIIMPCFHASPLMVLQMGGNDLGIFSQSFKISFIPFHCVWSSKIITNNPLYNQRCLEAWHISSALALLNRSDWGILLEACLHLVNVSHCMAVPASGPNTQILQFDWFISGRIFPVLPIQGGI